MNMIGEGRFDGRVTGEWQYVFSSGLEINQTVPTPEIPEPRAPSAQEREQAVQISIEGTNNVSKIQTLYNHRINRFLL